jgi:hypothetical protein
MSDPTPTDWRALCAELVQFAEQEEERAEMDPVWGNAGQYDYGVLDRARTALAQPEPTQDLSQLSDGYHTFADLYEHRHALCLALMRAMPEHCWYSWRHSDGERCFGGNDWFIIGIEPPGGNSVTYHLPAELYPAARATGAVELEKARPWDGHSAADVALRLKEWAALAQPKPQGPTDEEIRDLWSWAAGQDQGPWQTQQHCFARAVLARWGRPAIEPVPVDERLPGPEDCDGDGYCWWWDDDDDMWLLSKHRPWLLCWTHWLPHWALPMPKLEVLP